MTKTLRKTKIHGSELRSRLQLKRLRDNPRNSDLFLPRQEMPTQNSLINLRRQNGDLRRQKKMPTQNRLFSIFASKMVIYVGKMIFLLFYFIL